LAESDTRAIKRKQWVIPPGAVRNAGVRCSSHLGGTSFFKHLAGCLGVLGPDWVRRSDERLMLRYWQKAAPHSRAGLKVLTEGTRLKAPARRLLRSADSRSSVEALRRLPQEAVVLGGCRLAAEDADKWVARARRIDKAERPTPEGTIVAANLHATVELAIRFGK